jgi:hypothetical protein
MCVFFISLQDTNFSYPYYKESVIDSNVSNFLAIISFNSPGIFILYIMLYI